MIGRQDINEAGISWSICEQGLKLTTKISGHILLHNTPSHEFYRIFLTIRKLSVQLRSFIFSSENELGSYIQFRLPLLQQAVPAEFCCLPSRFLAHIISHSSLFDKIIMDSLGRDNIIIIDDDDVIVIDDEEDSGARITNRGMYACFS